jgi:hypothetical protein
MTGGRWVGGNRSKSEINFKVESQKVNIIKYEIRLRNIMK